MAAEVFHGRRVHSSLLGRSTLVRRHWRWLLPLMAGWWRRCDLSGYDLVLTSSHAVVNAVRRRPGGMTISYCSTPMRYAWLWRSESRRFPIWMRPLWPVIAALLRRADRRRSRNVDCFVANSREVASRIAQFYGRESAVVPPPVDVSFFTPDPSVPKEPFFLYAGRLVAYKRADIAVRAAEQAGVELVVAGGGPELRKLRRAAGSRVTFIVDPDDAELRELYRRARALVFPGVEDFGIVMAEAQACGTPVVAYQSGGALDIVEDGVTGVLYEDSSLTGLTGALASFDATRFDPSVIRRQAERFSQDKFDASMRSVIAEALVSGEALRR